MALYWLKEIRIEWKPDFILVKNVIIGRKQNVFEQKQQNYF